MNILILLIGGNNIANYAILKHFKENEDEIIPSYDRAILVHTEFSKKYIEALKNLLSDLKSISIDILLENEDDLNSVKDNILDKLRKIENISSLHLNYTGGRKPMSLGAFLAVEAFEGCINKIFSDISPKDYKLRLKRGKIYPKDSSLSDNIEITIDEFFKLHGNEKPNYKKKVSQFYSKEFVKYLIEKNKNYEAKEGDFYYSYWDKKYSELKKLDWKETLSDAPIKLKNEINLKDLQDFIKGGFLEEYIFDLLCELKEEFGLTDIAWNVKNGESSLFEVDLMVIKGYKSYMFSCTTSDSKKDVKMKLFEAIYRAEQIGGIRNTPVSISFANSQVIEELTKDLVKGDKPITKFIGIDTIRDEDKLKNTLREIIK